jgi:hypothetical protein
LVAASAESDAVRAIRASAATIPPNIPGIYTYAAPPKSFNPVTATDEELATYGFPPRPDKKTNPGQYAMWERAMIAAKIRWNGQLKPVPGVHGMISPGSSPLPEAAQPETAGPKQISTNNASGVIVSSGPSPVHAVVARGNSTVGTVISVIGFPVQPKPQHRPKMDCQCQRRM